MRKVHLSALLSCLLLAACAGPRTDMLSVSLDESMTGTGYEHLFLIAVTENGDIREQVEGALAEALHQAGVETTVSHQRSGPLQLEDWPAFRRQMSELVRQSPADGVLVTRMVREAVRMDYVPPFGEGFMVPSTTPGDGPGYFDLSGTGGYFTSEKEYEVQTSLYDVAAAREVWRVLSRTRRPEDMQTSIRQYVDLVVERLQQDEMLAP